MKGEEAASMDWFLELKVEKSVELRWTAVNGREGNAGAVGRAEQVRGCGGVWYGERRRAGKKRVIDMGAWAGAMVPC